MSNIVGMDSWITYHSLRIESLNFAVLFLLCYFYLISALFHSIMIKLCSHMMLCIFHLSCSFPKAVGCLTSKVFISEGICAWLLVTGCCIFSVEVYLLIAFCLKCWSICLLSSDGIVYIAVFLLKYFDLKNRKLVKDSRICIWRTFAYIYQVISHLALNVLTRFSK